MFLKFVFNIDRKFPGNFSCKLIFKSQNCPPKNPLVWPKAGQATKSQRFPAFGVSYSVGRKSLANRTNVPQGRHLFHTLPTNIKTLPFTAQAFAGKNKINKAHFLE